MDTGVRGLVVVWKGGQDGKIMSDQIYKQAFDFSSPALGGGISISDGDLIEVPLAVFP